MIINFVVNFRFPKRNFSTFNTLSPYLKIKLEIPIIIDILLHYNENRHFQQISTTFQGQFKDSKYVWKVKHEILCAHKNYKKKTTTNKCFWLNPKSFMEKLKKLMENSNNLNYFMNYNKKFDHKKFFFMFLLRWGCLVVYRHCSTDFPKFTKTCICN